MIIKGTPVSQGIAIGEVFFYKPFKPVVTEKLISDNEIHDSISKYEMIRSQTEQEICAIMDHMSGEDSGQQKIFKAHIEILFDDAVNEDICDQIRNCHYSPEYAIHIVYEKYIQILSKTKDPLIRERTADLQDVKTRLLRLWFKVTDKDLSTLEKPVVVVASDLAPSDTAAMNKKNVLAILTEIGGTTSHTAILAKSYGIPAILGLPDVMQTLNPSETVIVDAIEGRVISNASQEEIAQYMAKMEGFDYKERETKKFLTIEPYTDDGIRIDVTLNIGSAQDRELTLAEYTDGVGLFRTEFLYMKRSTMPSEDEQYEEYKKVLQVYGEKPVIIRTLDIGGDKQLECMELPKEQNPFLGLRALRLCFDMLPVFKTQLRALYRAGIYGSLWIMFPMVGSVGDIRFAKGIIDEIKLELAAEGFPYSESVKVGIMVEIPSIALMADIAASEVDFASIGTNDLCQYLTAVDRLNPKVAKYYQSYHPAMFRLIGNVVNAFNAQGKPISICGEMGGEPLATSVLIGLGLRKLSMNSLSIAAVKKRITEINIHKAERMAKTVMGLSTAAQVENFLKSEMNIK
ncbi:MAG TPA: phosphoenolpyruvate--protein phosphotransferase [Anaerovoracaceae bacterium]|nr:phosphoenolpyruvate--protein phosphotransferase [Anaerovoracaceae bacterium]